jgi:hypothetical protein
VALARVDVDFVIGVFAVAVNDELTLELIVFL